MYIFTNFNGETIKIYEIGAKVDEYLIFDLQDLLHSVDNKTPILIASDISYIELYEKEIAIHFIDLKSTSFKNIKSLRKFSGLIVEELSIGFVLNRELFSIHNFLVNYIMTDLTAIQSLTLTLISTILNNTFSEVHLYQDILQIKIGRSSLMHGSNPRESIHVYRNRLSALFNMNMEELLNIGFRSEQTGDYIYIHFNINNLWNIPVYSKLHNKSFLKYVEDSTTLSLKSRTELERAIQFCIKVLKSTPINAHELFYHLQNEMDLSPIIDSDSTINIFNINSDTELLEKIFQKLTDSAALKIKRLFLPENNLTRIPLSIQKLQYLTNLCLSNNNLTQFPDEIAGLTNLTSLYIENNQIEKLPDNINVFVKLESLSLNKNPIKKLPIKLQELVHLRTLQLASCKISTFPKVIFKCKSITHLYLAKNEISKLPEKIDKARHIQYIDLLFNPIIIIPLSAFGVRTNPRMNSGLALNSLDQNLIINRQICLANPLDYGVSGNFNLPIINLHAIEQKQLQENIRQLVSLDMTIRFFLYSTAEFTNINSLFHQKKTIEHVLLYTLSECNLSIDLKLYFIQSLVNIHTRSYAKNHISFFQDKKHFLIPYASVHENKSVQNQTNNIP